MSQLTLHAGELTRHMAMCKKLRDILAEAAGKRLYPYQRPFSDALIDAQLRMTGEEIISLWSRQSGKTEVTILTILALSLYFVKVLKRDYRVGIFAPAQSQAIDTSRRRLRERFADLRQLLTKIGATAFLEKGRTTRLFIIGSLDSRLEARIRCMSSDGQANVKGETLDLIIVEQSEDADEEKLKNDVFPMLSSTGGVRLLNGTSTTSIVNDYYFDACTRGGHNVFVVDCYEAAKHNQSYAAYVEAEKTRYGNGSPEFAAQYELKWEMVSNKFIMDRERFLTLSEAYKPVGGLLKEKPPLRRSAGWDPARGSCYSWVTVLEGEDPMHIIDWWFTQGTNLEKQAIDLGEWLIARGVTTLGVGSIGLGQGPADIFENHYPNIDLIRITENQAQQDLMFKTLEREIANNRLRYPDEDTQARRIFLEQVLRAERRYVGGKLTIDSPTGSTSYVDALDSLSLAVHTHLEERSYITAR